MAGLAGRKLSCDLGTLRIGPETRSSRCKSPGRLTWHCARLRRQRCISYLPGRWRHWGVAPGSGWLKSRNWKSGRVVGEDNYPGICSGAAYLRGSRRKGLSKSVSNLLRHRLPATHLSRSGSPPASCRLVSETVLLNAFPDVGNGILRGGVNALIGMAAVTQKLVQKHGQREVVAVLGAELPSEVVDFRGSVFGTPHHAGVRLVTWRAGYLETIAVDKRNRSIAVHQNVGGVHIANAHMGRVQAPQGFGYINTDLCPILVALADTRQPAALVRANETICGSGALGGPGHSVPNAAGIGFNGNRPTQGLPVCRRVVAHCP